jgi:hypothetical protein
VTVTKDLNLFYCSGKLKYHYWIAFHAYGCTRLEPQFGAGRCFLYVAILLSRFQYTAEIFTCYLSQACTFVFLSASSLVTIRNSLNEFSLNFIRASCTKISIIRILVHNGHFHEDLCGSYANVEDNFIVIPQTFIGDKRCFAQTVLCILKHGINSKIRSQWCIIKQFHYC